CALPIFAFHTQPPALRQGVSDVRSVNLEERTLLMQRARSGVVREPGEDLDKPPRPPIADLCCGLSKHHRPKESRECRVNRIDALPEFQEQPRSSHRLEERMDAIACP